MNDSSPLTGWRKPVAVAALIGSGLTAGAILGGTLSASAASGGTGGTGGTGTTSTAPATAPADPGASGTVDRSQPMRSDETLLTGDTAAKVTAAAKVKEPTGTIDRVETDSEGVYEAHLTLADGSQVIVQVDKDFKVTHVQTMGAGGHGGHAAPPAASTSSTSGA